jgi:RHS repeat-associated protein
VLAVAAAELTCTPGTVVSMPGPHVCAPIDANGNLTSDGARTFEWDARDQLNSLETGTLSVEYAYDGLRRRTAVIHASSGVPTSSENYLWCGAFECETRDPSAGTALKRMFRDGYRVSTDRFVSTDHLGSSRSIQDDVADVLGRADFDVWGRPTLSGSEQALSGFGGLRDSGIGSLWLAHHRAYDPALGRWISRDPLGKLDPIDGVQVGVSDGYDYVANRPIGLVDPLGLFAQVPLVVCVLRAVAATAILAGLLSPPPCQKCGQAEDPQYCQAVRKLCIEKCTEDILEQPGPPGDKFGPFRRCLRDCMAKRGCTI